MCALAVHRSPLRPQRGFTLVELLVVVSIIALLIAILLPSLKNARQLARRVACGAQCHQLGTGMHTYLVEYNLYPPHQIHMKDFDPSLSGDFRLRWFDLLALVLADSSMTRKLDQTFGQWEAFKRDNAFFDVQGCPSTRHWDVGRNNSYGYNYKYLGSYRDNASPLNPFAPRERFPVRNLRAPGGTIAFADSDGTGWTLEWGPEKPAPGADHNPHRLGNHGYILDPTFLPVWSVETYSDGALEPYAWSNWRTYLSDRHLGRSNVAFVDGHAESVLPERAYADNAMWNGLGVDPGLLADGTQNAAHALYRLDPHVSYKLDAASGQEWRRYRSP